MNDEDNKFSKFNKNRKPRTTPVTTHGSSSQKRVRPKIKKEQSNKTFSIALTPSQYEALEDYATEQDRSKGYIIKKLLIDSGIIKENEDR